MKQQAAGLANMKKSLSQTPSQQLAAISAEVKRIFRWHNWALEQLVLPQLRAEGICLLVPAQLSTAGTAYLRNFYVEQVDKLLTPIKCAPVCPILPKPHTGKPGLAILLPARCLRLCAFCSGWHMAASRVTCGVRLRASWQSCVRKLAFAAGPHLIAPLLRRLDPAHPFPYLPSGSLNIAVELRDPDVGKHEQFRGMCAIVNIPSSLPKWIEVPAEHRTECASVPPAPLPSIYLAHTGC